MRELPASKILVQVLAAEEHLVDIAGAWDVPGGGACLFQFPAFRKHMMKVYGAMQVVSCHIETCERPAAPEHTGGSYGRR